MTDAIDISFTLNGEPRHARVPQSLLLVDLLRDHFQLLGAKIACDQGACGACTVLVDGLPLTGCLSFAFAVDGRSVTTIEGVTLAGEAWDAVQQALHEHGAPQCGFCMPGQVLLAKAMTMQADEAGSTWMNANICRCTGYEVIRRSLARWLTPSEAKP